jgi:thiol-disulfide isomerase/thioredoxin
MLICVLMCLAPQAPATTPPSVIAVPLAPGAPGPDARLGWSPKGATVPLQRDGEVLRGSFPLGPEAAAPVRVELSLSPGAAHFDRLAIDLDRDGTFADRERFTTVPKEQRGKWWSSFEAVVQVPFGEVRRPYPMSLWFVADPAEPAAPPALRWSRRGWCEGTVELDGKPAHVLVTEAVMDGVFTAADSWQLARDGKAVLRAEARKIDQHAWLDGKAWRLVEVAADGSSLRLESCVPELSEAQERERADTMKADREAKRAPVPMVFGHDLAVALAEAERTGKRVFVDFETTWCGPCKQMDQWVYTAAPVVDAGSSVIAVKLDGDEQKELVKRYEVKGYPTLLLLDGKGAVVRREVGYRSVAQMVRFFAP